MIVSAIYQKSEPDHSSSFFNKLNLVVEKAVREKEKIKIFFRADDIAVPSHNFSRLMELFLSHRTPLCLAVVPSWITPQRWESMRPFRVRGGKLFCWHMHGYRHQNHETSGKKQEFGPARSQSNIISDLTRGYSRLSSVLKDEAFPVFTPPWNRCSKETLQVLKKLKFKAVSRSDGAQPLTLEGLDDYCVHVDLHTRKEKDPDTGRHNLIKELEHGLSTGVCGIMIHHMRMNDNAFLFLDTLLAQLSNYPQIKPVTFQNLIDR